MPDEFDQIRTALENGARQKDPNLAMVLDNQRVIMATLATLVRGGHVPIELARDLHERAKKITSVLDG